MKSLRIFIHTFLEILFPEQCLSCRQVGHGLLCQTCSLDLSPTVTHIDTNIICLFSYNNSIIKQLLWELKYHSNSRAAAVIGPYLADTLVERHADYVSLHPNSGPAILVPVPISRSRTFKRGFNQAERLATAVTENYPDSFEVNTTLVTKIRSTKPQVKCASRSERLSNVIGAFTVKVPTSLAHRQIIVIDDVSTTGATIREVIKVLKKNGAKNVSGLVVAHGSKTC